MFAIELTRAAERDLEHGTAFYERQAAGLGTYFLDCLISDIDALHVFAGIHPRPLAGFHRALSKRFPFAIYYAFDGHTAYVVAVLDCRQQPGSVQSRLADSQKAP